MGKLGDNRPTLLARVKETERANLGRACLDDIHQKLDQVKSRDKNQQEQSKLRHITKRRFAVNQKGEHGEVGVGRREYWTDSCDHH